MTRTETLAAVRDILVDGRSLLEDPDHWTQGAYARDAQDRPLIPVLDDDFAVSWSAPGAVIRATKDLGHVTWQGYGDLSYQAIEFLRETVIDTMAGPSSFNDGQQTRHRDVLAWFDRAIALVDERSKA